MTGEGHGGPARRFSWPPFEAGNRAALRHGAQSPALVEARARDLVPGIFEANPHLDAVRDAAAVYRYAINLARVERVYCWLAEQPDTVFADAETGVAHGAYGRLEVWERQADKAEERLAIAPLTRARLGLDLVRAHRTLEDEIADGRDAWRTIDGTEVSDGG